MPAYAVTVFLGAFLLFQIEPLIAKYLLPWFGGAPAVWTTCMLFFQLALLGGYLYAHALARASPPRARSAHLALLGTAIGAMGLFAFLWRSPILPDASWKPPDSAIPVARILKLLSVAIGVPFFLLSSTAPLMQAWAARANPGARVYRLYALSNAGALLALLTYPFFIERVLTVRAQALVWSAGFLLFALASAFCAVRSVPSAALAQEHNPRDGAFRSQIANHKSQIVFWSLLSFCGSILLLATTNQMCLEVAAIPFLWVLPLALYLLSFVFCFGSDGFYRRWLFGPLLAGALAWAGLVLYTGYSVPIRIQVAAYSAALFAGCVVCHGELARSRPAPQRLTSFYVAIASGGAAGGLLVALVAPRFFRGFWEIHMALFLTGLLALVALLRDRDSWVRRGRPWPALLVLVGAILLACRARDPQFFASSESTLRESFGSSLGRLQLVAAAAALGLLLTRRSLWRRGNSPLAATCLAGALGFYGYVLCAELAQFGQSALSITRNFYGVLTVERLEPDGPDERLTLRHGRIVHGVQYRAADRRRLPTTYYGRQSGIGLALLDHPRSAAGPLRVGAVGLGVGTLAAYGRPGDTFRFYEINPAVVSLSASERAVFRYVPDSAARVEVCLGDARLSLEREAAGGPPPFDVLAVDAFSSDAIPVHLLTRQALQIYLGRLAPGGILALHVSNRQLDLVPIVRSLAESLHLPAVLVDVKGNGEDVWSTTWVLLSRDASVLSAPGIARVAQELPQRRRVRLWTDDYSNLFDAIK